MLQNYCMKGKIKAHSAFQIGKLTIGKPTKKRAYMCAIKMMPAQMYARFEGFIPYGEVEVAS